MAIEVYDFSVTVPAGTAQATPQVSNLSMPPRVVTDVEIRVPPGPRGLVGLALGAAGVPVIPRLAGQWIVTDDEVIRWPLEGQITSGAWQLRAYNTGSFAHTLHVRFLVRLPEPAGAGLLAPLAARSLSQR